jgi:syntaxin 7
VDRHIDNSVASTAQAKAQLSKAAKTQKSNSSLVYSGTLHLHSHLPKDFSILLNLICLLQICLLMVIFGVVLLIVIIVLAA